LAKFFQGLLSSKAHWYWIKAAKSDEPRCDLICSTFPLLSYILSFEDKVFNQVLVELGLASYRRGDSGMCSQNVHGWEIFISEFDMDIEITKFTIQNHHRHYLLLGSWRENKHPKKTPAAIWRASVQKGSYDVPKLRISSISIHFTAEISKLDLNLIAEEPSDTEVEEANSSEEEGCSTLLCMSDEVTTTTTPTTETEFADTPVTDLSPIDYPLLSSLGINTEKHMDKLLQEVVKLSGRKSVHYIQANNRSGWLVPQPSLQTKARYSIELAKNGSLLDEIISSMMKSFAGMEAEAADCLINALYQRFEESFISIAIEKGVARNPEKKMDAASVEAMLSEAQLNTKNSRVLFKHLNSFLGQSFFESEMKRREYFAGQDYPPTVNEKVLEDKAIIPYWYKSPDGLLKHQLKYMVTPWQLLDLHHIDLTIGGDHGGGKFCRTLKILFRFWSNPTTSCLFQIASVSHSKDELSILCSTVLEQTRQKFIFPTYKSFGKKLH